MQFLIGRCTFLFLLFGFGQKIFLKMKYRVLVVNISSKMSSGASSR